MFFIKIHYLDQYYHNNEKKYCTETKYNKTWVNKNDDKIGRDV